MIVRFIRPEVRNALSGIVLDELEDLLGEVVRCRDLDRLVFTGTDDVFASGADLGEIASMDDRAAYAFARRGQSVMTRIQDAGLQTAAAINGYCYGGALDLALACEKRVASPGSTFCHPGAGLGIITGWGGTQRLPRLVGESNALEMFFTASPINAAEALRIGLIDGVAEDPLAELSK